ncbi:uncharacterized protein PHACADRAFT_201669 [Phanerochaete carnosa HHB-10118-sp]|uniref:Uncharacterized protein n=1 Tax=Phanerochaete carnosa (strain HHB-10118-sp) TaxID=650164 RepID=K5WGT6_PHACS|nr:uncharacterized protein PHACADRAFT_201669 [Phanerochaete carnosa HHB-10118-sp]EKM49407.1 hypothetical protein PHACADRAFT_201669 [Phanerochaete carnosa HHB-10118-sp]
MDAFREFNISCDLDVPETWHAAGNLAKQPPLVILEELPDYYRADELFATIVGLRSTRAVVMTLEGSEVIKGLSKHVSVHWRRRVQWISLWKRVDSRSSPAFDNASQSQSEGKAVSLGMAYRHLQQFHEKTNPINPEQNGIHVGLPGSFGAATNNFKIDLALSSQSSCEAFLWVLPSDHYCSTIIPVYLLWMLPLSS